MRLSLSKWHRLELNTMLGCLYSFQHFQPLTRAGCRRSTIDMRIADRRKRTASAHQPHLKSGSYSVPTSWKIVIIPLVICQLCHAALAFGCPSMAGNLLPDLSPSAPFPSISYTRPSRRPRRRLSFLHSFLLFLRVRHVALP